jgi:signal transduction histidine kinase
MKRLHLSQRLSAIFAALLLACCGASAWLQMRSSERHEQEVVQRLSFNLASHIARHSTLMDPGGVNAPAVHDLFEKLMDVNPSVEVYLLAPDGRIQAQAAPAGHLKRERVDMEPVKRLLAGDSLPVFGDDPRSDSAHKVFSAAPLRVDGQPAGYVYVVLLGEQHDALAQHVATDSVVRTTLWSMALVAALGLLAGLTAFHWITRPLRQLTEEVHRFQADGGVQATPHPQPIEADEIATLRLAFAQMTSRIAEQWRELTAQDQQRRELVANISHDLRTPLTSLHGYLETLRLKANVLSVAERQRYLDIAIGQSRKVGRLAQELFELARLECGVVKPEKERFSLAELLQDVFQKFELSAEAKRLRLDLEIDPDLPVVTADLGMIERVLTNLLDNAIRHTPADGRIEVRLRRAGGAVEVQVRDSGPGVPESLRANLFTRPSFRTGGPHPAGGLGLVIVQRILQLHGSDIRLVQQPESGAVFRFQLSASPSGY